MTSPKPNQPTLQAGAAAMSGNREDDDPAFVNCPVCDSHVKPSQIEAIPAPVAVGEIPPMDSIYRNEVESMFRNRGFVPHESLQHLRLECRERQLREAMAQNATLVRERDELARWKSEAMSAMRESEEWRGKLNDVACRLGYAGRHYLESGYEMGLRAEKAEAALRERDQPTA